MIIYYIKCLSNEKNYFGQTTREFNDRKWEHITRLNNGTHSNEHLLRSWKKYGKNNFEFGIIQKCSTIDHLNYLEESLIRRFKSNDEKFGFNKSFGGDNKLWLEISKQKARKTHSGTKRPWLNRAVLIYDTNGAFIQACESIENAALMLKCSATAIRLCCIGKNPSVKNNICIFQSDKDNIKQRIIEYYNKIKRLKPWRNRMVSQYNPDGELVKIFISISDASKELKLDSSTISKVCRGIIKRAGGYIFKYSDTKCA